MAGKLQKEIGKTRPFDSRPQEAFLNLLKTADRLTREVEALFKPHNLSMTQYNVLRILRGSGAVADASEDAGLPCGQIAERMITRDPDITRLLDRMEKRSLIVRHRDAADRRVVRARITPAGLQILHELDQPLLALHARQFAAVSDRRVGDLIDLLEELRPPDDATPHS